LTTLPKDRELLRRRVDLSARAFETLAREPAGESYLLAMEDLATRRIVGTSGIVSRIGGFVPFFAYQLKSSVSTSAALKVRREIQALHLLATHDGPSEIGTLFLSPAYRHDSYGAMLSLSRFLFMAEHRQAFGSEVIAELRGVVDECGRSPFWEAVGRHFFGIDFHRADLLSMKDKSFITELMPQDPIYVPLLPAAAQEVIGQLNVGTKAALRILEREGFEKTNMVDIFDAGPIVRCDIDRIVSVRLSTIETVHEFGKIGDGQLCLIANGARAPNAFRCCGGQMERIDTFKVRLEPEMAETLEIVIGDTVRILPLPRRSS
jgi:arginine N-succinyltransferase